MASLLFPATGSLCASLSLPLLVLIGLLIAELLAKIGGSIARFVGYRPVGSLDLFGVAWLLGILILGTTYLGLALMGLFFPLPIIFITLFMAAIGGKSEGFLGYLMPAVRALSRYRIWLLIFFSFVVFFLFATISTPYLDEDGLVYHCAFPWQCLQIHGIPISNVTFLFHLPLPIDMTFALPLIVGDDRLAKWMIVGAFAALGSFVAGHALASKDLVTPWLAPLIAFASPYMFFIAVVPKNDAVAAAFFVVGALMWRGEQRCIGALFLGGSLAVKLTIGPFVVAWLLFHPPHRRRILYQVSLFILPVLPWLVKTWLATGNPVFPAFWKIMHSPFWGHDNQVALEGFRMWVTGSGNLRTLIPVLLKVMKSEYMMYLIALPVFFLAGRWRLGSALILGYAGTLYVGGITRYLVPGIWLESVEIASLVVKAPKRVSLGIRGCLFLVCFFQIFQFWQKQPSFWPDILRPASVRRDQYLTTYATVSRDLNKMKVSRIILAGGWRSYLLPGRALFNGYWGETPVIWSLVRSSFTEEQLRRRFRQLGFNVMLYNFVSGDLVSSMDRTFVWTDPMLRLYADFCRHRLLVIRHPDYIDGANGGFYLLSYDLSSVRGSSRPLYFLPTAESAIWEGRVNIMHGRFPEAKKQLVRVLTTTGQVGQFVTLLAEIYALSDDWNRVYDLLAPFGKAGLLDNSNLPRLGEAAAHIGRYDEAVVIMKRCLVLYCTVNENRVNLAWTYVMRARLRIREKRIKEADADLDLADETISSVLPNPAQLYEIPRKQVTAELYGTRAELMRINGHEKEANKLYGKAIDLCPDIPQAKDWRRQLGPK